MSRAATGVMEAPTETTEFSVATASIAPTIEAVEDRRITRSKRALRAALIELIEERGLPAITVGELCSRADLNRGTFYNHFDSIDHILKDYEDEFLDGLVRFKEDIARLSLLDLAKSKFTNRPFPFLVEFFDYLQAESRFLHAVLGPGGDGNFGLRIKTNFCAELVRSILHERYRTNPTPFVEYYIEFYATAYLGVILHWLETGMQESSEEMGRIAMRLLFIQPGEPIEL